MNKFRFTINALAIAIFTLAFASMAQAQATRTWVSGVGDDVNPCSRTAPCKTFAGAISKTAVDGEIDCLDPGGFGAVTITKAITLDGGATGEGSILASLTNGINVNVSTPGVTNWVQIRNLSINGAGSGLVGVNITGGTNTTVSIENCVIFGFRGGSGRGVADTRTAGTNGLFIADTLIKSNLNQGVLVSGAQTNKATLERVNIWGNGIGVSVTGATNTMNMTRCVINKNTDTGISVSSSALADVHDCFVGMNATGIDASASGVVKCARTVIVRNSGAGIGLSGGTILSYGNNEVSGNGSAEVFSAGGPNLK